MIVEAITKELYRQMEKQGAKAKIIPVGRLGDLRTAIETRYNDGEINDEVYQEHMALFNFDIPADLPDIKSIIIVAYPQPQTRLVFNLNGEKLPVIIPPQYDYVSDLRIRHPLARLLETEGYTLANTIDSQYPVSGADFPQKLLAVQSGLAQYGRNNLTYVDGMGSFLRFVSFFTDLPCVDDDWREAQVMERCDKCTACLKMCPTNAISPDRFLLYAERCLTHHNERGADFPDWIDSSWHRCLVGCLDCQIYCPVNKNVSKWVEEGAEFSHEETMLILQGASKDQLSSETLRKLEQHGMIAYFERLPRNLCVLGFSNF
jgi:epoxyqueuosine reductase